MEAEEMYLTKTNSLLQKRNLFCLQNI